MYSNARRPEYVETRLRGDRNMWRPECVETTWRPEGVETRMRGDRNMWRPECVETGMFASTPVPIAIGDWDWRRGKEYVETRMRGDGMKSF